MKRHCLVLLGVVGMSLCSSAAHALSLSVSGYTLGEDVTIASGAHTGTVDTAELSLSAGGFAGYGYCVDLAQTIGVGTTTGWTLSSSLSDSVTRAAWLVDTFRPEFPSLTHSAGGGYGFAVTRATEIAALQVAVWEVMSDAPGHYDLYSGSFALAAGGASDGVMNLARDFLADLSAADLSTFDPSALWATNPKYQDQLFVFTPTTNPIPEPATATLYLFGAGLAALSLRKRHS